MELLGSSILRPPSFSSGPCYLWGDKVFLCIFYSKTLFGTWPGLTRISFKWFEKKNQLVMISRGFIYNGSRRPSLCKPNGGGVRESFHNEEWWLYSSPPKVDDALHVPKWMVKKLETLHKKARANMDERHPARLVTMDFNGFNTSQVVGWTSSINSISLSLEDQFAWRSIRMKGIWWKFGGVFMT